MEPPRFKTYRADRRAAGNRFGCARVRRGAPAARCIDDGLVMLVRPLVCMARRTTIAFLAHEDLRGPVLKVIEDHDHQCPEPQIFSACWNAGDWGSPPGPPTWMPTPPLLGNSGSGKPGTPCLRMHCALAIAASF